MKLDAIGVVAKDVRKSMAFYELVGFTFPEVPDERVMHIEAHRQEDSCRLMIDDREMIKDHSGINVQPSNFSAFAILCDSPEEVNETVEKVRAAGYSVAREPWDAMWGQRYAVVVDPDGYGVDLFAPLPKV